MNWDQLQEIADVNYANKELHSSIVNNNTILRPWQKEFLRMVIDLPAEEQNIKVINLLGNTGNGKSFLASHCPIPMRYYHYSENLHPSVSDLIPRAIRANPTPYPIVVISNEMIEMEDYIEGSVSYIFADTLTF